MAELDTQKIIAKKKRIIMEVAGQIHDVVEDTLWSHYHQLPALSEKIQSLMADLDQFKKENGL
ncbi:MAG: CCE_0567 family metalloprotein [Formivibrio sp.]|nr:CCE_0567 family metalloprotein [Formivibrio sp.]